MNHELNKTSQLQNLEGALIIGQRIPQDYFVTTGKGESDITVHAGSYHLALKDAGIEICNIMTYSSILPPEAREVEKPALRHGAVMESIMAVATSPKGELATAGIIYGWLYNRETGQRHGGLVCEHNGNYSQRTVEDLLNASIEELYTNGFSDDFRLQDVRLTTESFIPKKKHGTALVALCFTTYIYPIIGKA